MPSHVDLPEAYFLLAAILVGKVPHAEDTMVFKNKKLDLDTIWQFIFNNKPSEVDSRSLDKINICGDTIVTILVMLRILLSRESRNEEDYPTALTQLLFYMYHNVANFMTAFMSGDVLTALVGTLFPPPHKDDSSGQSTPSSGDSETDSEDSEAKPFLALTTHPAKKNVINFMRVVIVDSLSLLSSPKNPPVIDLLLDAQPEGTNEIQRSKFQTELLAVIMDHLLAADVLIGDQAALPIVQGGHAQYVVPNVFYLASRLVDKLWQGVFRNLQTMSSNLF